MAAATPCVIGICPYIDGICPYMEIAVTARDRLDPAENPCFALALRKASRRLSQLYDDAMDGCGLRSTQFAILSQLNARSGTPPTLAVLAEALVVDRSAMGHNLRPLERDGLVELVEGEHDRRQRLIVLTAKGKAKYREARAHWKTAQKRFTDIYGAEEGAALRSALIKIAHDERLATLSD